MTGSHHPGEGGNPEFGSNPRPTSQDIQHVPVSARVPEKVRQGVFCTATMILQANEEFVFDFVSAMVQPQQVVARVVVSAFTTGQFVSALRTNLVRYQEQFGPLLPRPSTPPAPPSGEGVASSPAAAPAAGGEGGVAAVPAGSPGSGGQGALGGTPGAAGPPSPPPPQQDIAEIYDHLKLPDDMLGGVYANTVIISHTPEEFCFDFVASFFPRSAVTARVFMAAGRVPSFLETMADSFEKYQHKRGRQG